MKRLSLKEIQKLELNILLYLDKICKENKIKYYLSSGTLLGAVKYKGFIPWDDDIDVILLRPDYIKLINVLKDRNDRYKILSIYNTKDYYYAFAKLVDSKTTLTENARKIKDLGVYIDIVPIDGFKSNDIKKEVRKLRIIKNLMVRRYQIKNCIRDKFDYINNTQKIVKYQKIKDLIYGFTDILTRILGYNFWAKMFDKKLTKIDIDKSQYIGVRTGSFDEQEVFLKEELLPQAEYEFEGHFFPSFKNYDLYLKRKFGNYHKDPKKEQQQSHHQYTAYYK